MNSHKRCSAQRLLLFLPDYFEEVMGGAELQAKYLAQCAIQGKNDVNYLYLSNGCQVNNPLGLNLITIQRRYICLKLGNIYYPYAFAILNILKKIKPDVIYNRTGTAFTGIAAYYAKKNNCRLIFHIAHDKDVSPSSIPLSRPYLYPEKKIMQYGITSADVIIAQTHYQDKLLQQNYHRNATVIIPNGHPVPEVCVKSDEITNVLWIANWKSIKQPEIFVELARKLAGMSNVHFIMMGRTGGYQELVNEASECGVEVLGEIPNSKVNELLSQSHILVNTSKQEGFSNTFIQAWMRKVPVVSLQVDPDDVLNEKGIGYCSGNFQKLISDTKRLIEDRGLLEDMGNRARNYAVANHSLKNLDSILEVIAG